MNGTFFDILGALIGFVTVMLLLSMVVTGLVQATQSLLRLRGRNLLFGLQRILQDEAKMSLQDAKDGAREILNNSSSPVLLGRAGSTKALGKLMGPQVSWLKPEQLKEILDKCPLNLNPPVRTQVEKRFSNIQDVLSKRFLRNMRLWTIIWALPVAFYFQVSAPALLSDFFKHPELRAPALRMAPDIQTRAQASLGKQVTYEQVSADALEKLADKHTDLRETIEEASGVGQNKGDIVAELAQVLSEHPQRAELLLEYEALLDEHYQVALDNALEAIGLSIRDISQLNIEPWREDWAFYVRGGLPRWRNWVGVAITMILLSFGAPFWFSAMRNFINLRDALKPPDKEQPNKPEVKTPQTL